VLLESGESSLRPGIAAAAGSRVTRTTDLGPAGFVPGPKFVVRMARSQAYTEILDAPDWAILGTDLAAGLVLLAVTKWRLGKAHSGS
jgi:hypothetical protein